MRRGAPPIGATRDGAHGGLLAEDPKSRRYLRGVLLYDAAMR